MGVWFSGLLVLCYLALTWAMFFDLGEQEEKCIIEEVPQDTLVTGYFLLEYWDTGKQTNSPHLGITVIVRDPDHQTLMSKRYGRKGKFTFTSHSSGQHFLCMQSNSTRFAVLAGQRLRLHLDVQMGEHTLDPSTEKAKDMVKTVEYNLRHLIDQIHYISKQQDFQREREETFRRISEETNGKILWWAVLQTAILLTVGVWQMKRLQDFLIEKKLV
ncbi:transmembrane emp24 domain-containing protein 11 [Megalops cyprinoides]|uniref:transmembrane emp24 domain-containing protein 11 n=1 Tax=Megalops cyprinoides TaxID=118141 RepID=UPI00186462AB|nr:transmembrane emp24 domain-containing protein 11 [Megalops cyprinoides]